MPTCMRLCGFPALLLLVALAVPFETARAQGGPPLLTDDPETPGAGHWEINVGFTFARNPDSALLETPRVDFNYGWGPRIQLKYELPWVVLDSRESSIRSGLGNSLVGVKWRFLDEERYGISISTYPQIEFNNPTSSAHHNLVERGRQFLLPIEMARKIGPLEATWEWGYNFREHQKGEWVSGFAAGHQLTKRLELLGEIHGTALRNFNETRLLFDVGGRLKLTRRTVLLYTTGRVIRAPREEGHPWFGYLGLQFNL